MRDVTDSVLDKYDLMITERSTTLSKALNQNSCSLLSPQMPTYPRTYGQYSRNGRTMPALATLNRYMARSSRNRMIPDDKAYIRHLVSNQRAEATQTKDDALPPKGETPWI